MNFNSLFFPAPSQHYSMNTHFGELIYIPKDYSMISQDGGAGEPRPRLNVQNLIDTAI